MAGVAAMVLLAIAWVATHSEGPLGLLYSGLDVAEAGRIGQKLQELKVPFQVKGDGSILLVPETEVARVRMELAAAGLPEQQGAGYELLDKESPMNMTSFMQRLERTRALEGELARSIIALGGVRTARVHIVMPDRDTFERQAPKPTASVAVVMNGPMRLSPSQAAAIRLLVSGAVPGLRREDVSVLDPSGVVLAANSGDAMASDGLAALQGSRERQIESAVTNLLEPLVGAGKVRVMASVDLDSAREVSQSVKYDPLSQVERSKQTQVDKSSSDDTRPQPPVSVGQNLPNQPQQTTGAGEKTSSNSSHDGQTVNYEINTTHDERVREPGDIRRLTVAVLVDGTTNANGVYQPQTKQELDRVTALVKSAVGFDAKRGDVVTVDTMRFVAGDALGVSASRDLPNGALVWSWMEPAAIVLLLLLGGGAVLLFVRRGARLDLLKPRAEVPALAVAQPAEEAVSLPSPIEEIKALLTPPLPLPAIEGPLTGLYELMDSRPDEALAVLRAWIGENS